MKTVLKGLNWATPRLAIQLANKYIGSKWVWMGPLLTATQKNISEVRVLQVTVLTILMRLFIPQEPKQEVAMSLHRFRRRAVLVLLNHCVPQTWASIWRLRSWTYYGHILRKPPEHPVRRIFLSLKSAVRPQGGFPNTPLRWLTEAASAAYGQDLSSEELLESASDREQWLQRGRQWVYDTGSGEWHNPVAQHTWTKWQATIQQHVPWMFNMCLVQLPDRLQLVWVDTVEGLQQWSLDSHELLAELWRIFAHVRMSCSALVFVVSLTLEVYEANVRSFTSLQSDLFTSFEIVLLTDIASNDLINRVRLIL